MTIYLYSGTPGSGKSLDAASDIRFELDRKYPRPVIGNFPIDGGVVAHPDFYRYRPNDQLTAQFLTDFAAEFWDSGYARYREDYLTLVVDECQLLFNSRTWSAKDRMEWLEFLSQHRKYGYKVILIAQSPKMVDNQFRMLVEYEINHRKASTAGPWGKVLAAPFMGRLFVRVRYYYQMNERLGASWYVARKKDMVLYDTNARFERSSSPVERAAPDPSL